MPEDTETPLTRGQADRLLELMTRTVTAVEAVDGDRADLRASLDRIEAQLAPVKTYYEAVNREHADASASAVEAGKRKQAAEDNAKAELLAWLTPKRAAAILVAVVTTLGCGGPATGLAGKYQDAVSAAFTAASAALSDNGGQDDPDGTGDGAQ